MNVRKSSWSVFMMSSLLKEVKPGPPLCLFVFMQAVFAVRKFHPRIVSGKDGAMRITSYLTDAFRSPDP